MDFDALLTAFAADQPVFHTEDRPRLEQECVTAAIRGWKRVSTEPWPAAAEPAVRDYFREELDPDTLASHETGAAMWALFATYALGWIFASKTEGILDDEAVQLAFARLPGFMWLHEARVTGATAN